MAEVDRTRRVIEGFSAVLLALGAVTAAWAGYQSSRWSGVQAIHTAEANAARLESSRAATTGGQFVLVDVGSFFEAVDALADGDQQLFEFYDRRLRDEFRPAFEEWLATDPANNPDAPLTPFELDSYRVGELEEAVRLDEVARKETEVAAEARQRANSYTIAVVLLAAALFFGGISTKFHSNKARVGLLAVGMVVLVSVVTLVAVMPKSVAL
jgi:hypothetical protein